MKAVLKTACLVMAAVSFAAPALAQQHGYGHNGGWHGGYGHARGFKRGGGFFYRHPRYDPTAIYPFYVGSGGYVNTVYPAVYTAPAVDLTPPPPPETYVDNDSGSYCRQFSQVISVNGRPSESYGTACLQPDGTWRVVQ